MSGINWDAEMDKFYPDPQNTDEKVYCQCSECKFEITNPEEKVWQIEGEIWCEDCAMKIFRYSACDIGG